MKAASTVAVAYTELPNTWPISRIQTIWYTNPQKPDRKKQMNSSKGLKVIGGLIPGEI